MTLSLRPARAGVKRGFSRLSDRVGRVAGISVPRIFITTTSFVAPVSGDYLLSLWGGGGAGQYQGSTGGSSAAFCRKKVTLAQGDTLSIIIGGGAVRSTSRGSLETNATASSISGPNGLSMTANGASDVGSPAAVATGGDTNLNGMPAPSGSGANSPTGTDAYGEISGGRGGYPGINYSGAPGIGRDGQGFGAGGGAGLSNSGPSPIAIAGSGADGTSIITYLGTAS